MLFSYDFKERVVSKTCGKISFGGSWTGDCERIGLMFSVKSSFLYSSAGFYINFYGIWYYT